MIKFEIFSAVKLENFTINYKQYFFLIDINNSFFSKCPEVYWYNSKFHYSPTQTRGQNLPLSCVCELDTEKKQQRAKDSTSRKLSHTTEFGGSWW